LAEISVWPWAKIAELRLIGGNCRSICPQNLDFGLSEARLRGECAPDWPAPRIPESKVQNMAKAVTIKVKLVSSADTGFYYVAKKNSRTMTDKLVKKKYDPVARKHVEFKESKIK
jgi:large subunit ribosomal protein L33